MRTGSHACRILITGCQLRWRAARLPRAILGHILYRHYASVLPNSPSWQKLQEASRLAQSQDLIASNEDVASWIAKCDPFLPLELRSGSWDENLSDFKGVRSAEFLPRVLADSNYAFPYGMLTHIALGQRRWSAALFLCRALFRYENKPARNAFDIHKASPWSALKAAGPLVDVNLLEQIPQLWDVRLFQDQTNSIKNEPSLDYVARTSFLKQDEEALLWKSAIGQAWRCIGHVMLATTRENSPLQVDMIGFVLQVIAAMHSDGVMPDAIYLFETKDVASDDRKPPFLHLMSSRIMTVLSDVMWKKAEPDLMRDLAYVVARHAHKGSNSPAGENGPRIQALEHEVWIELILWGCVHQGHYHEGVELLRAMFGINTKHRWKTVRWNDLEELLEAKLLAQENQQKAKNWYQRLASSTEGYSQEKPYINLGRNTVSREVVARLCDGMLSTPYLQFKEHRFTTPAASAEACMDIFDIANRSATETAMNTMLYRISDASIENVVRLCESIKPAYLPILSDVVLPDASNQTPSIQANPQHSLLVKQLAHHVDSLDVQKALTSYEQLKVLSGNADHGRISKNASVMKTTKRPLSSHIMDLRFLVPTNLFASLLNLVTGSRLFQKGESLIAPFLSNGKMEIDHESQRSSALSEAITRFAGISSNRAILAQIEEGGNLNPRSMGRKGLAELLHLEISSKNWFVVRRLLTTMTQSLAIRVRQTDIARIAARIIKLDANSDTDTLTEILIEILSGQYRLPRSPGQIPNWEEPRQLNQLSQILVSTPDESFSVLKPLVVKRGQAANPTKLETHTFNILLEAVVEVYGMEAGQEFVQRWCETKPKKQTRPGDRDFYPFSPNLETLKIVLQPFLRRYQSSYIKRDIFTKTGTPGKDARTLEMLRYESGHISRTYETILAYYYGEYGRDLSTVFWAMDVCHARDLHQERTFYSLLQPTEDTEITPKVVKISQILSRSPP